MICINLFRASLCQKGDSSEPDNPPALDQPLQRNDVMSNHSVNGHRYFNFKCYECSPISLRHWWYWWNKWRIFDDWWWMLERNCQIRGDRGKTVKFAEAARIREFCESRPAKNLQPWHKPALFRAHKNWLPMKTTFGTLRNWKLSWLKQHNLVSSKYNSTKRGGCITVVKTFML